MAVINEPATLKLKHPQDSGELQGARVLEVVRVISIAAGDDDGSAYLLGEVPDQAVIESISIEGAAITGGSAYKVGLADADGNMIDDNCFADTTDFSSTTGLPLGPLGSPIRQLMSAVGLANARKRVFEHAAHVNKVVAASGETQRKGKYRVVLTAATVGSAAATLVCRIKYQMYA
ncbi:MAG: hypothetical protein JST01_14505 [Cyanobacteria bacterium SZAS TMP-1]|nr:hypothetical protein [Cyanobacteria bacterium SZAS TMP-1]